MESETVTIFAGTGTLGFSGEGGPATAANLNIPNGLVFDTAGNLFFDDGANFRLRKVDTNGIITTIAGTGVAGFSGDGGPATSAKIRGGPLAFDSFGNLYMSDSVNNVIRILDNTPPTLNPVVTPNPILLNTSATVTSGAADTGSGLASQSCGALVTTSVGRKSVTCTATDKAGNTNSATVNYEVYAIVSGQVTVTQNGFARNRATGIWSATVKVTNASGTAITGPIEVALTNLTPGVTMVNNTGTFSGSPYITVSPTNLAAGASANVVIQVTNPSNGFINYSPVTYSGALQ